MLKIGLTGNIGSGKSIVATIFTSLGVPVFHADKEARKLFDDPGIKNQIRDVFGLDVFTPSGDIIRTELAEIVFCDPKMLGKLNGIIHPAVRSVYQQWCLHQKNALYTLYEAAILFESGYYKQIDKVICITAPEEVRIKRVMSRDGISRQEVEKRNANQWEEARKIALADYVIRNDETESVIKQVLAVHIKLIKS